MPFPGANGFMLDADGAACPATGALSAIIPATANPTTRISPSCTNSELPSTADNGQQRFNNALKCQK